MKIHDIFCNENKFVNAFGYHNIYDLPFQGHNIIFNGIIPFSQQFYNGKVKLVICK